MSVVQVFTAARMAAIEAASVVSGTINGSGRLILTKHDNSTVDAGQVVPTMALGVTDTDTIDLSLSGSGTIGSPWALSAASKLEGTTSQRNAYFGDPSVVADQVTLANKRIMWFNTDYGWLESYYALAGSAGLTVPGLISGFGTTAGWYPVGEGPYSRHLASGSQNVVPATWVTSWAAWGSGGSTRHGGSSWFTYSGGKVTCVKAGYYEAIGMTSFQTGTGAVLLHMMKNSTSVMRVKTALDATYPNTAYFHKGAIAMTPNDGISLYSEIGSYTLNYSSESPESRGELTIRYKGPLLASD